MSLKYLKITYLIEMYLCIPKLLGNMAISLIGMSDYWTVFLYYPEHF